jgi:hypothetical protein
MGTADSVLNIRMLPAEKLQVKARGEAENLPPSVWAREVLLLVVNAGLDLAQVKRAVVELQAAEEAQAEKPPPVVLRGTASGLGATVLLPGTCLHPMHLREQYPTFDQCRCGHRFAR